MAIKLATKNYHYEGFPVLVSVWDVDSQPASQTDRLSETSNNDRVKLCAGEEWGSCMETRTIVFVGSSSDLLRMLMVQIEIGTNTADDNNNNSNSNWDSSPWGLSSSSPTNWYLYPSIGFLSTN